MKATTPAPALHADLQWLFGNCDAELGVHSNFDSMITACKVGSKRARIDDDGDLVNGCQEDLGNEDLLIDALDERRSAERRSAARRSSRILAVYHLLDVRHQRVLEAAYEPRQWPAQALVVFGHVAGVVAFTATARAIPPTERAEWLARAVAGGDPRVDQMKRQAEDLFTAALAAYDLANTTWLAAVTRPAAVA